MSYYNDSSYQQYSSYGQQYGPQDDYSSQTVVEQTSYQNQPQPPAPWFAQWDDSQSTWCYINQETNERSYDFSSLSGGYSQQSRGYDDYSNYDQSSYSQQDYVSDNSYDSYNGYQNNGYGNGGLVDDAAAWTGEKVQEVEDIPGDIVHGVEDIPDDIAHGVGDVVGDVDRFGDGIDNSFDAGRDEQRYSDDYRDNSW